MAAAKKNAPARPARPHAGLGNRLRQRRNDLGISIAEIAVKARITTNHLYRIERGEVMPHERKLFHICNVLGLRADWVRTGDGKRLLGRGEHNGPAE